MNRKCPFCLWPLSATEAVVACRHCAAQYHADCYEENDNTCATFGCAGWATPTAPLLLRGDQIAETAPEWAPADEPSAVRISFDPGDLVEPAVEKSPEPEPENGAVAYCSQCGNKIATTDRYCFSCGNPVEAIA